MRFSGIPILYSEESLNLETLKSANHLYLGRSEAVLLYFRAIFELWKSSQMETDALEFITSLIALHQDIQLDEIAEELKNNPQVASKIYKKLSVRWSLIRKVIISFLAYLTQYVFSNIFKIELPTGKLLTFLQDHK